MRALIALTAVTLSLPPACAKLGIGPKPKEEPVAEPPAPLVSATPPPVWRPPQTDAPPQVGSPAASQTTETPPTADKKSDYERAVIAAKAGRRAVVRSILEVKVRSGGATDEEAQLLYAACKGARDKKCTEDVLAKYPAVKK
jgi:hypothetical protein